MSERWGFDLSMEAVRLLRRTAGQWQEFAVEKLEGDNIEGRLARLVAKADTQDPVDIFLPRDQILYTDVKLTGEDDPVSTINAAMDGRTPYALDDLEIDWERTDPETARVAAIARETLEEAEAFVTQGGLSVRAFSSLAAPEDFPRAPIFGEVAGEVAATETPTFATARDGSRSADPVASASAQPVEEPSFEDSPVVKVDDPTPVLQLPKSELPPLNPGAPLPRATSVPRVHTNVGASVAEARAASLTAPTGVTVHKRDRAVPTPALAAIAAALSIAIAIIIWSIVPTAPQSSEVSPDSLATEPAQPRETAGAAAPEPEPAPAPTPLPADVADTIRALLNPEVVEATPALAWTSLPTPDAIPRPDQLTSLLAFAPETRPEVLWLEPRPTDLIALDDYLPTRLSARDLEARDAPALAIPSSEPDTGERPRIARLEGPASTLLTDAPAVETASAAPLPEAQPVEPPTVVADAPEPTVPETQATEPVLPEVAEADGTAEQSPDGDTVALAAVDEAIPTVEAITETDAPESETTTLEPALPSPTELAAALTDIPPRPRPGEFLVEIERQKFGGRTLAELSEIRPGTRPDSAQFEALAARAGSPPSELAVQTSVAPRSKPSDFDAIVAAGLLQLRQEREARALAAATPDTSDAIEAALAEDAADEEATRPQNSPRLAIPSNASVARQATIEDAIRLNRISLVGVFGRPSDRRALVRLPSGDYVKVGVGDRVDGGIVAGISESALQYQKGGRMVSLTMPQG